MNSQSAGCRARSRDVASDKVSIAIFESERQHVDTYMRLSVCSDIDQTSAVGGAAKGSCIVFGAPRSVGRPQRRGQRAVGWEEAAQANEDRTHRRGNGGRGRGRKRRTGEGGIFGLMREVGSSECESGRTGGGRIRRRGRGAARQGEMIGNLGRLSRAGRKTGRTEASTWEFLIFS